jgi:hypothetical protein
LPATLVRITASAVVNAPRAQLPALKRQIAASLEPAKPERARKVVAMLIGQFKSSERVLNNPEIFVAGMNEEMARYPEDVLNEAIKIARRKFKFVPAIAEMIEICDELMKERRDAARYLEISAPLVFGDDRGCFGEDYFWWVEYQARARREAPRRAEPGPAWRLVEGASRSERRSRADEDE